jgi:hypothetical protein
MKPLVDWAEKEGKIETELLKPTDKPLEAADKLYDRFRQRMTKEKLATEQSERAGRSLKTHLRTQAYNLVRHLIEEPADPERRRRDTELTDDRWRELKTKIDGMRIRWNDEKGVYEKEE